MVRASIAVLMVVAAGLMTAAGCNTSVGGGASCPSAKPAKDAACEAIDASCEYQDGPCAMTFICDAQDHAWRVGTSVCQPEAVSCWDAFETEGDVCAIPGERCGDECSYFNECGEDHVWHASYAHDPKCCWDQTPNECDLTVPPDGFPCDPCHDTVCYDGGENFGDCASVVATCEADGVWHVGANLDCP